jgi:hypothetical protein
MHRFQLRVVLDERFDPDDVKLDLRTNELHPLHEHDLHVAVSPCGGAELALTLTAVDLWTALLTTMALVRNCGYVPSAVEASGTTALSHSDDEWPADLLLQVPGTDTEHNDAG